MRMVNLPNQGSVSFTVAMYAENMAWLSTRSVRIQRGRSAMGKNQSMLVERKAALDLQWATKLETQFTPSHPDMLKPTLSRQKNIKPQT
jgi:hypothetical protein